MLTQQQFLLTIILFVISNSSHCMEQASHSWQKLPQAPGFEDHPIYFHPILPSKCYDKHISLFVHKNIIVRKVDKFSLFLFKKIIESYDQYINKNINPTSFATILSECLKNQQLLDTAPGLELLSRKYAKKIFHLSRMAIRKKTGCTSIKQSIDETWPLKHVSLDIFIQKVNDNYHFLDFYNDAYAIEQHHCNRLLLQHLNSLLENYIATEKNISVDFMCNSLTIRIQ